MKKLLFLLLAILLPMSVNADDSGPCGENLTWTYISSTNTLTISGTGTMTDYGYLSSYSSGSATWSLYTRPWEPYVSDIRVVEIGSGVNSIGWGAFRFCSNLHSVTISNTVLSIGELAFYQCSSLVSVTIPNSVTSIGRGAFEFCSELAFLSLGNGITSISDGSFRNCWSLFSIIIPDSVTSIGNFAFEGCGGLVSVTIPSSVKSIGSWAFKSCGSLASVHIPNIADWCNIVFGSKGNPLEWAHHLFVNETEVSDLVIPNEVTSIGDFTFIGCSYLNSVTLSNTLTTIGNNAFSGCTGLYSFNIPNSVTSIGNYAFSGCKGLNSILIPNSVTFIGERAFYECTSLSSIIIPNSITSISDYLFDECHSLASVSIPNSVTSIGEASFCNCFSLNSLSIPNSVVSINRDAFAGCSNLKTINIPENIKMIKIFTFSGCSSLESITIPSKVEIIYQEAFSGCNKLESIKAQPKVPPFLYDNSFSDFSVPLKVPKGCKEAYQSAQGWKNFTNISDADKYKLIYIIDGENYKTYEIEEGTSITPEPAPTKEGYTFSGWSEIPETMPAHDVTVTGTFTVNKYKLIYKVDGAEYMSYEIEYGAAITPEAAPTKEGYTFSGWSKIPETMPAHDVTVTGTFTINKYKLTYTIDGEEYKSYDVEYGATITPEPAPTKEGHTFSGWSEIPKTMPAHDVTVTGTFSINKFKLTYIVDGGEYKSYELDYGASITPEAAPTKEGYTFSGWSEIPETMPAHDVTVTGTFSINSYKLTYMIDDKVYKETMYEYGATITPEPQPEGDYATFEWKDLPQTMPAHDVVVYASYTSGIIEVLMTSQQNMSIYSPNGKKLNIPQKGINIVILEDGTVKKVMMK